VVLVCGLLLALAFGGSFAAAASRPEPRPLGRDLAVDLSSAEGLLPPPGENPAGELALRQALAQSLLRNPGLAAFSLEVRAREAQALQAGLLPNPELTVEMENFAGSGEFSGLDAAESTVSLGQLVELGGKRGKRRTAAALEAKLAGWDYEAKRLDVLTDTAKAFVEVLASQERLTQATELAALAERFFQTVRARVEAGKVSPVEQTRAQVAVAAARLDAGRAERSLAAARQSLAALWGEGEPVFSRAVGALADMQPVTPLTRLAAQIEQNPDLARWATETEQRRAGLALARAGAIPDLTVGLGVRNDQVSGDSALVAGVSIPLPVFDRNQGGVAAARAALNKACHEQQSARSQALASLGASYRDLASAYAEGITLKGQILPAAESAFEAATLGYQAGKFGFLEVLDAQRTLFEVRGQYLEALTNYHQARAEVERMIGAPLDSSIAVPEQHQPIHR
jgi:cobalt-zinc-cadmium efflux system outer membrane protein